MMQLEQNFSDGRTDGRTDGQEFPVIDLIKFLCAILVVVSHVPPLESFTANAFAENLNFGMIHYLARIAVPFYFSAAGFFLFRKINFDSFDFSVFRNYIFKNLRLLGLWSVLLFAGGTGHLWFMGGLFVAVCLLGILLHYRVSMRKMAVLAIVLYAIGLTGDSYYGILVPLQNHKLVAYAISGYEKVFGTTRNGIFMGFPFLLLGGVIRKCRGRMKPGTAFLGFIVSMAALLFEAFILKRWGLSKDHNMYCFLLPAEYFLLSFAVTVRVEHREIYKKMRVSGIVIYFSHMFFCFIVKGVFFAISYVLGVNLSNSMIMCILTIGLSTCFGFVLERLSHTDKFQFLRYLYS